METTTENSIPQLASIKKKELSDAFVQWLAQQDAGVAGAWIAQLDADKQAAITHEIAGFCEDAGFNISWLIQSQIKDDALRQSLENVTLSHLQSTYEASIVQPKLELYKTIVKWLNNSTGRKYRQQTRDIYVQLVNSEVIPTASADTLLGSDKNRWEYIKSALNDAYHSDSDAVAQAVKTVIMDQAASQSRFGNLLNRSSAPEPAQLSSSVSASEPVVDGEVVAATVL